MTAITPRAVTADPKRTIPAYFRLLVRGQLSRGRVLTLAGLALVAIGFTAVSYRVDGAEAQSEFALLSIAEFGVAIFVPLACLLLAIPMLGNLVEDRLLVYAWLKPTPRWHLAVAAFAAVAAVLVPVTVLSLVAAALVAGEFALAASAALAAALGVAAYGALYLLCGLRFSWGIWLGLAHLIVYENLLSQVSDGLARFSIRSYLLTLVELGSDFELPLADRGVVASVIVPVAVAVLAVGLTARVLASKDVD